MRGTVVLNNDPMGIGRIKVRVYSVHGTRNEIPDDQLDWAYPKFWNASYNSGTFIVPEVGNTVWVEFENGNPSQPVYSGGCYGIGKNEVGYVGNTDDIKRYQRAKIKEVPIECETLNKRMLYKSPKGSKIFIDDSNGKESIRVVDAVGQVVGLSCPMDTEFSKNNGHLDNSDMTQRDFEGWGDFEYPLTKDAAIVIKSLTGSKLLIKTDKNGDSIIEIDNINRDGEVSQIRLDSQGNIYLQSGDQGIVVNKDEIQISGKRVSINSNDFTVNGKGLAYEPGAVTHSGSYSSFSNILIEDEKESFR